MKNKVITQFVHPKTEEPIYEGFVESINDVIFYSLSNRMDSWSLEINQDL